MPNVQLIYISPNPFQVKITKIHSSYWSRTGHMIIFLLSHWLKTGCTVFVLKLYHIGQCQMCKCLCQMCKNICPHPPWIGGMHIWHRPTYCWGTLVYAKCAFPLFRAGADEYFCTFGIDWSMPYMHIPLFITVASQLWMYIWHRPLSCWGTLVYA